MATIGEFPIGPCVSVGTLGFKMGILILSLSATQECLVLLLLDDSPCVPAGSCVTVAFIGKLPTGSCVSVGNMEILVLTTFIV